MNFEATKGKFRKIFPWEKDFEIKRVGSTIDLLYITKFCLNPADGNQESTGFDFNTDIDVLFIPETVFVANKDSSDPNALAVLEPTDHSIFVKLRYNRKCQFKVPDSIITSDKESDNTYISSQKFLKAMEGYMNVTQQAAEITGPSLQILPRAMHTHRSFLTSADIVFAFRNPEWPEQASEWLTRERPNNWPPTEVVDEIQRMGSHVVAKGNQLSPEVDLTWMLSFNMAERHIAKCMSTKQRKCFLTAKTLIKETKIEAISSYHTKSVLWWLIEQGDKNLWLEKGVGQCFLAYLEELIKALKQYNIKNYIMPENNMIKHVSTDAVDRLTSKLQKIRRKPMSSILNSPILMENSEEIFSICPDEEYHFNHVKDAMLRYTGDAKTKHQLLQYFKFHFLNLGPCFVVDPNQREKGITLLKKVSELLDPQMDVIEFVKCEIFDAVISALGQQNRKESLSFLAALLTIITNEEAVKMLSEVVISTKILASLFHDTGCVFLNWSRVGFWKQQREDDLKSSEKCFMTSVTLNPRGPGNHAEFAHFLLVETRYEEAVNYAEKAIKNAKAAGDYSCLSYTMADREVIDNSIGRHVQYEQGITVPAIVVAYHVLVQAKKNLGKIENSKPVLGTYLQVCLDKRHTNQYEAVSVYGYSCMSLGLYKKAKEAFMLADSIKQSQLQEDNIELCNNCIASDMKD